MSSSAHPHAIILAAGMGRRLEDRGAGPKALLDIHGRSVLERALSALARQGVRKIAIVVGHEGARIVEHVASRPEGGRVEIVWNHAFATTDSAYSLWCARHALGDGAIVLNGDVVFADHVLTAMHTSTDRSVWLATPATSDDDGSMLVVDAEGRVTELAVVRRGRDTVRADFLKSAGILSLSARAGAALAGWLDRAIDGGYGDRHFDDVLRRHLPEIDLTGVVVDRESWAEIDDAADLRRARRIFAPPSGRLAGGAVT